MREDRWYLSSQREGHNNEIESDVDEFPLPFEKSSHQRRDRGEHIEEEERDGRENHQNSGDDQSYGDDRNFGKLFTGASEIDIGKIAEGLRPGDGDQCDGVCTDTFPIRGPFVATEWVMRNMDIGEVQARRDREQVEKAAALLVVTAPDDRVSLIQAGEVLERLLLTITHQGLQYTFLNQPVEVGQLRQKLQKMTRSDRPPQLLVCLGSARESTRPAPRRPLASVMS